MAIRRQALALAAAAVVDAPKKQGCLSLQILTSLSRLAVLRVRRQRSRQLAFHSQRIAAVRAHPMVLVAVVAQVEQHQVARQTRREQVAAARRQTLAVMVALARHQAARVVLAQ